jgi:hypothetical protein
MRNTRSLTTWDHDCGDLQLLQGGTMVKRDWLKGLETEIEAEKTKESSQFGHIISLVATK